MHLIAPLLLIVLGAGLGLASLSPSESLTYATTFPGTVPPGNTTLILPAGATSYVQLNLSVGNCGLRLYPATGAQWLEFNATGALPPTWIGCANRTATVSGDVEDLILVNGGSTSLPYEVVVRAYLVASPYDWLALPGTALALAGLLLFVPQFVLGVAVHWRDAWDYKKEKK